MIFYSPVIFGGRSLQPSLYTPHGFTAEGPLTGPGRSPVNSFNVDIATGAFYEFPLNKLVGDIYKGGEVPLWNPYQAAGTPLAAQYSTKAFFPYQILEDISPPSTWDFYILGRFLIAGFFTFLFLSAMGLAFGPAFAGGLFYMFSGTFVWFASLEQLTNTAMLLPVVLYCMERLAKEGVPGWRRFLSKETALAGVAIALMLLAGQPEVALYGSALAALYFFVRVVKLRGLNGLHIEFVRFSLCYVIGLGLAAPLLLIFIEFVGQSHHIHPAGSSIALEKLHNWKTIFVYLTPTLTEFPADPEMITGTSLLVNFKGGWYRFLPLNGVWDTLGGYTGAVPVLGAVAGVVMTLMKRGARAYRAELLFFFIFALVILLKNTGVIPFVWIGLLPLFDRVWSLRWAGPAFMLAASVAGAIGLETLYSARGGPAPGDAPPPEGAVKGFVLSGKIAPATAVLLSVLLFTGLYAFISFVPAVFVTLARGAVFNASMSPFVVPSILYGSIVTLTVMVLFFFIILTRLNPRVQGWMRWACVGELWVWSVIALAALELWWAVPRGYAPDMLGYKWVPFAIGLVIVCLCYFKRRYTALAVVPLFLIASFAVDAASPRGFPDRRDPYEAPPYVEFLKDRPGHYRAIGSYGALFPNYASTAGLLDLRYVNSLLPSVYHLYRVNYLHTTEYNEDLASTLWFTGRPERIVTDRTIEDPALRFAVRPKEVEDDILNRLADYSFMGVRYFVMPKDIDTPLSMVYNVEEREPFFKIVYDKEVRIFENPLALKRSFMVYGYEEAGSFKEAQERAFGRSFDPAKRAVLEAPPPYPEEEEEEPGAQGAVGAQGEGRVYKTSIREYTPNKVFIDVESDSDGMLVLTDVYYPGWRVEVNGQPADIYRVNGLVRGVALKAGSSSVIFSYRPATFKTGMIIFLVTAAVCVVISCGGFLRRFRRR
jgi:hypothetical protein